ncbi:hypothetical protein [Prevotella jejuni]|jgi:hypothetical protein
MIKTEDIKRLLDRYYDGTTTEEEEEALRTYFNGSDIDASLREESVIFTALQSSECPVPTGMEGHLSRQISQWNNIEVATQRTIRHINLRWVVGIAASLLLLFATGAIVYQNENNSPQTEQDTYTNAKDAYAETSKALMKFSKSLNKGIEAAENVTNKTRD